MIAEYLEAEHKGGGKDYINIEVRVKADCVHEFASSVRDATVDLVLEIIKRFITTSEYSDGSIEWYIDDIDGLIDEVKALKGGDAE